MSICQFLWNNGHPKGSDLRLRVIEAGYRYDPRWLEFCSAHPDGRIFHNPGWLHALESEYGQKCIALACEDADGNFHGILPLFRTRGFPLNMETHRLGKRLSSLPRTPLGGPLAISNVATTLLIGAALERLSMSSESQLEIKSYDESLARVVEVLHPVPWRKSYILRLRRESEGDAIHCNATDLEYSVRSGLRFGSSRNHLSIKCSVNKAIKVGVVAEIAASENDLRQWYRLYLENMRDAFVPARPYRFFATLRNNLQHSGAFQLWSARLGSEGEMIAGVIVLMHGRSAVFAFAGARRTELWRNPYDLLHWSAIHEAWKDGYTYYDFGEVADNDSGLRHYKRKWGAEEIQMYRYYYPAWKRSEGVDLGYVRGVINRATRTVWRSVPLLVTSKVGDWIYNFL